MTKTVISVEHLSKRYQLGIIGASSLQRDLNRWWARKRGKPDPYLKIGQQEISARTSEYIWALNDINFEVKQGETLGIIGRNGAGKSTLLKILSRVTAPTLGKVKVKGRIGSLLEVGTGFHPELTGRENVYLNGAILGMTRAEVNRKFDKIIDFAGVEKFIDTPVKRYSSGMYVRLAFAVAAHLDPDILIVDEVLAVGDTDFQKKCIKMMGSVAKDGRTVLVVSHNMSIVKSLCQKAILLDTGKLTFEGNVPEVIEKYLSTDTTAGFKVNYENSGYAPGDKNAVLLEAHIEDENGKITGEIDIHHSFLIKMKYEQKANFPQAPYSNFHFYTLQDDVVFITSSEIKTDARNKGVYEATCIVPGNLLNNQTYLIGLALTYIHEEIHVSFFQQGALSVTIYDPISDTLEKDKKTYSGPIPGSVRPKLEWRIRKLK